MTPDEFDTQLADLETRVDRLRALYENWFRGYEKAEPSVARKEVERKVYAMRKELPRNTALRFRYHQLYQRYTTLASYWQRTARQIEEGTYRLQLKRLKRRNDQGTHDENALTIAPRQGAEGTSSAPPAYELHDETLDLKQLLDEAALSSVGDALEQPAPKPAVVVKPATRRFGRPTATFSEPPTGRSFALEERDHEGLLGDAARRGSTPSMRASTPSLRGSTPLERGSERMQSGHPTLPPSARIPAANTGAIPGSPRVPVIPPAQAAPPPAAKIPPAPKTGAVPLPARPAMASPSLPPIPKPPIVTGTQAAPPRPPPPPPPASKAGAFAAPPPTGGLPKPSPRASVPPGKAPAPAPPAAARPAPPRPPVPPPPPRPAPPPAAAKPAPEAPIADQRMRRLYDEYTAARRKNNEGEVRYETLQSSIQKMMPDLRKKHQGKDIDFEVVIKDGRVGLKPKAT